MLTLKKSNLGLKFRFHMYRSTKQQQCYSMLICMQTIEISKLETQRFDEVYCIKAPNLITYAIQWDQNQIIVFSVAAG